MSHNTKPIELGRFRDAIQDVGDAQVKSTKAQLVNSVQKLRETNTVFNEEIDKIKLSLANLAPDAPHDELKADYELYSESLKENEAVIGRHLERIEVCLEELQTRGLLSEEDAKKEMQEHNPENEGIYL